MGFPILTLFSQYWILYNLSSDFSNIDQIIIILCSEEWRASTLWKILSVSFQPTMTFMIQCLVISECFLLRFCPVLTLPVLAFLLFPKRPMSVPSQFCTCFSLSYHTSPLPTHLCWLLTHFQVPSEMSPPQRDLLQLPSWTYPAILCRLLPQAYTVVQIHPVASWAYLSKKGILDAVVNI